MTNMQRGEILLILFLFKNEISYILVRAVPILNEQDIVKLNIPDEQNVICEMWNVWSFRRQFVQWLNSQTYKVKCASWIEKHGRLCCC